MIQLGGDIIERAFVVFLDGEVEQVFGIGQTAGELVDGDDNAFQRTALTTDVLRLFRVIPDARIFEFAQDFFQTLLLQIVVKDTPGATRCAR